MLHAPILNRFPSPSYIRQFLTQISVAQVFLRRFLTYNKIGQRIVVFEIVLRFTLLETDCRVDHVKIENLLTVIDYFYITTKLV